MTMQEDLLRRVRSYSPRLLESAGRFSEAAVLMPITRSDEPELVLTLRASGLSTHGGEVAFPGGRRDPEDPDLVRTALREAEEEIGLPPGLVEVVGPLSHGPTGVLEGRGASLALGKVTGSEAGKRVRLPSEVSIRSCTAWGAV